MFSPFDFFFIPFKRFYVTGFITSSLEFVWSDRDEISLKENMSSGKYSKGGKKLGDAISLTQHKSATDGNKSTVDNPESSSSTLSSNENESEGRLAEKKSRKRKKETPVQKNKTNMSEH